MSTQPYVFISNESLREIGNFCREITRIREQDVNDFTNLSNVFMSGRKVGKIPTSSTDIIITDRIGDFNYDADYLYICVEDSGAAWRRITLGSW